MITLIIIAIMVVVCLLTYISLFNTLKIKRNQIENAFSVLDALFIKRSDLIPNLITVAKEYMEFEKETLMQITKQRMSRNSQEYIKDGKTDNLLKQFMLQVENYPDLKANQQFLSLQHSFNECEEQIAAGRRFLSASITDYNDSVTTFPGNIVAEMNNMRTHEWERAEESQRRNVNTQDLFDK